MGRLITKPDHDPDNPYHYHNVKGEKVVITPEDWERYKDDPTFKEIREAVEAEQTAHPTPEYDEIENPAFTQAYNNLRSRAAGNQGALAVNWWNGNSWGWAPLPEGYSRDKYGVVTDTQGNYYTPQGANRDNSTFYTPDRGIHGHTTEQYYRRVDMPNKTISVLRQSLPVDKVFDISRANFHFVALDGTIVGASPSTYNQYKNDKRFGNYFKGWTLTTEPLKYEVTPQIAENSLVTRQLNIPDDNYTPTQYVPTLEELEINKVINSFNVNFKPTKLPIKTSHFRVYFEGPYAIPLERLYTQQLAPDKYVDALKAESNSSDALNQLNHWYYELYDTNIPENLKKEFNDNFELVDNYYTNQYYKHNHGYFYLLDELVKNNKLIDKYIPEGSTIFVDLNFYKNVAPLLLNSARIKLLRTPKLIETHKRNTDVYNKVKKFYTTYLEESKKWTPIKTNSEIYPEKNLTYTSSDKYFLEK